jgi:hypothetical protein
MGQKLERSARFPCTSSDSSRSLCFCLWLMRIRASVCLCLSDCLRIILICFDVYKCNVYSCKQKVHYDTELEITPISQLPLISSRKNNTEDKQTQIQHQQQKPFTKPYPQPILYFAFHYSIYVLVFQVTYFQKITEYISLFPHPL